MTVRLQKPFASQTIGTLYTGASEAALIAAGSASLIPTTAAGTGPAAAAAAVRLSSPFEGRGVGTLYAGANGAAAVAGGFGYYEGTVGAGTPNGTPTPTPTPSGLTVFAGLLAGADIGAFTGTVGSPRYGDRPLTGDGYTSQFFTVSGGRLLVGSDF